MLDKWFDETLPNIPHSQCMSKIEQSIQEAGIIRCRKRKRVLPFSFAMISLRFD